MNLHDFHSISDLLTMRNPSFVFSKWDVV